MIENRNQVQLITNHLQKLPIFSNSSNIVVPPKKVKSNDGQKHKKMAPKPPFFHKSVNKSQTKTPQNQ